MVELRDRLRHIDEYASKRMTMYFHRGNHQNNDGVVIEKEEVPTKRSSTSSSLPRRIRKKELTYPTSETTGAKYIPNELESSGSESEEDYDQMMMPVLHGHGLSKRQYVLNFDDVIDTHHSNHKSGKHQSPPKSADVPDHNSKHTSSTTSNKRHSLKSMLKRQSGDMKDLITFD